MLRQQECTSDVWVAGRFCIYFLGSNLMLRLLTLRTCKVHSAAVGISTRLGQTKQIHPSLPLSHNDGQARAACPSEFVYHPETQDQ